MTARTGIPSISDAAHELCRLVSKYQAVIALLHPGNSALLAALSAALAACAVLQVEVEQVRDYGD